MVILLPGYVCACIFQAQSHSSYSECGIFHVHVSNSCNGRDIHCECDIIPLLKNSILTPITIY